METIRLTLTELNQRVATVVNDAFSEPVWITAELSDVRQNANGHCYMQLVEKDARRGTLLASAKGMIWANRWWLLRDSFQRQTGQAFASGLKVMLLVQVQMHEAYGYGLNILDVDPTYTLGEMARRRLEILRRLEADGIIDMNRELPFPLLPQRVAIVSAAGAAGYEDFCHQLDDNALGLQFYHRLFPAAMQGERTEASVMSALEAIYACADLFDVVVIIRGGGATADLASFDSYAMAEMVANFPLPVITGIGHDRDQTVLDRVAHRSVKTPTAAAALLIDCMATQLQEVEGLRQAMLDAVRGRMERETLRLTRMAQAVQCTQLILGQQHNRLALLSERIKMLAQGHITRSQQQLDFFQKTIQMAQPDNLLRRGFSIVRQAGKAVRNAADVTPGQQLDVQTAEGHFRATVNA